MGNKTIGIAKPLLACFVIKWIRFGSKVSSTYTVIKIHVVRHDVNVGVEDLVLSDHLLQDVSHSSWEDQQRHMLLLQVVKEPPVALPGEINSTGEGIVYCIIYYTNVLLSPNHSTTIYLIRSHSSVYKRATIYSALQK